MQVRSLAGIRVEGAPALTLAALRQVETETETLIHRDRETGTEGQRDWYRERETDT